MIARNAPHGLAELFSAGGDTAIAPQTKCQGRNNRLHEHAATATTPCTVEATLRGATPTPHMAGATDRGRAETGLPVVVMFAVVVMLLMLSCVCSHFAVVVILSLPFFGCHFADVVLCLFSCCGCCHACGRSTAPGRSDLARRHAMVEATYRMWASTPHGPSGCARQHRPHSALGQLYAQWSTRQRPHALFSRTAAGGRVRTTPSACSSRCDRARFSRRSNRELDRRGRSTAAGAAPGMPHVE